MSVSSQPLVFRPVAAGGGLVYALPDGRRLARNVMEQLADAGMLRRVFSERINVCPTCNSSNVLFREVCPHCQGPGIDQPEVIHHFPCAGVFRAELFGVGENLVCPKCHKALRHVGVDHEYGTAEFVCQSCGRASSVVPTYGRCLDCSAQFPSEQAGSDDWFDYVPTEHWDDAALGASAADNPAVAQPVVLIVDDVEDNLNLLQDILADRNVRTLRAADGPAALQIAEAEPLDLVILDVSMPVMDGFEVARRMRAMKNCATVPIIFLTAFHTTATDVVSGLGAGANDYATKPFDEKDLMARVEAMLRRGNASRR